MVIKKTILSTLLQLFVTAGNFYFGILMAQYFGASASMDAYVVVANVIALIYGLFMHFQTKALIPYMAGVEDSQKKESVTAIFRFNTLLFGSISVLVFLLSRPLAFLLAPGLEPWQVDLAASFLKISSLYLFFSNVASLGSALMEYNLEPIKSLIISLIRVVGIVLFLFIGHSLIGIYSLPVAHLLGVLAIIPLYLLFFRKYGYTHKSSLPLFNDHVTGYRKLLIPLLIGQIMVWGIRLSDSFLASFLNEGALSYITYSQRIVSNFSMLFTGFFIVYFPLLTRLSRPEDNAEHICLFYRGYEILYLISLAAALFIALFSPQIVTLLFERGKFTAHDSAVVSELLRYYAIMMYCAPIGSYLANAYYGRRMASKAIKISVVSSLANIILNVIGMKLWGIVGLAAAASLSYLIGNILQAVSMKSVNPLYRHTPVLIHSIRGICVVLLTGCVTYLLFAATGTTSHDPMELVKLLTVEGITYCVVLGCFSLIFRYPFAVSLVNRVLHHSK